MRIIPVLDLKGGEVVRARAGRRDSYRPIVTPLCHGSEPVAVAGGLRTLFPFDTFYVADLDVIEGRAPNEAALSRLRAMPDPPELWVDAGLGDADAVARVLEDGWTCAVIGSESQQDDVLLRRYREDPGIILSLDFFADGYRGPRSLLEQPELWPQRVIVMTLARVGQAAGPDFALLQEIRRKAGNRSVIAAGGVRGEADLLDLASFGIDAALVATALHDGTITPGQLASLRR